MIGRKVRLRTEHEGGRAGGGKKRGQGGFVKEARLKGVKSKWVSLFIADREAGWKEGVGFEA